MSVYNSQNYLYKTISNIIKQTYPNFELIIINDGSTDNSKKVIKKFNDNRIYLFENKKNLGLTKSLNIGISQSSGKYILRQDADDISFETRIENQLQYMKKTNSDVVTCGTIINYINFKYIYVPKKIDLKQLEIRNPIVHGSILIKKDALNSIGNYDSRFRYSQDYDLWLRLLEKKYIFEILKTPLYELRKHPDQISLKYKKLQLIYSYLAKSKHFKKFNDIELTFYLANPLVVLNLMNKQERNHYYNSLFINNLLNGNKRKAIDNLTKISFYNKHLIGLIFPTIIIKKLRQFYIKIFLSRSD